MDDVTKRARRKLKADVCQQLAAGGSEEIGALQLGNVDARLRAYCLDLARNPEQHNLYELLALRRFLRFCRRYELRAKAVQAVVTVIESLKFPTTKGMRPLKLSPVEVFMLTAIYGFYDSAGRRVTRNVLLFVPRKFGKTTLVAGIAIYELLFGDADGQVFVCANSYNQAKICFDVIRRSLKALDRTGKRFRVNREAVYNLMKGRTSFANCLASDPTTLDGLNASCYILDEFSQARDAGLRNVMSTSQGTRDNPLELIITTASDVLEGPCATTLEAYERILEGKAENDAVFALIFQPDVDDRENDPVTWRKVQPHLGYTVKEDYYERKWNEALQTSEDMLAFRTKLLNIFAVNESKAWLTPDEIRALFRGWSFDSIPDATPPYCMVSFDLSVWDDFSSVCYEIYRPASGTFHFHVDYYLPEGTLARHPRAELYREWIRQGHLKLVPGDVMDYDAIARDIIARNGPVLIAGIGYDPYKSKQAVNTLSAYGAASVLKPIKQTYGAFTASVESMELLVKTGACSFSPNPITAWCFGNCMIDEDNNRNRKPIKRKATEKIDGAITCLMCQDQFLNFKR